MSDEHRAGRRVEMSIMARMNVLERKLGVNGARPILSKIQRLFILSISAAIMPSGAALSQSSIYDRCLAAIDAGDQEQVSVLAKTIRRFNSHPALNIEAAERCISAAEGKTMRLYGQDGEFVSTEQIELNREAEADRIRKREELLRQSTLLEVTNRTLIANDVVAACNQLYEADFVAAMTNRVCLDTFSQNGHPRLKGVSPSD